MRTYIKGKPFKYPTKEKILPSEWKNGRPKSRSHPASITINKIETKMAELISYSKIHATELTADFVRNELDKYLNRSSKSDFFTVAQSIIDDRKHGRELTKNGKVYSEESIRSYRDALGKFQRLGLNLHFNMTTDDYQEIGATLTKRNLSVNYVGKLLKHLKTFFAAAESRGVHRNQAYKTWKVPEEQTPDIYLTQRELDKIYNHHLINKTLDRARDWFIIDCYTGLRIADIRLMNENNFKDGFFKLSNKKTGKIVVIPLHPYVRDILKKWKGLPPKMSKQKINMYIKQVCELSGIKDEVLFTITKGGKKRDFHYKKFEMVSNHTARRSFITNMLKAGHTLQDVMKLAGIRKAETLLRYQKETVDEVAARMKEDKFFRGS